jgi:D-xylose transport system ATP-binding protein
MNGTQALRVRGAVKRFGSVEALRGVDLAVSHGEILALLGDNGAGKSTLIKCISGVHPLDEGEIHVEGQLVRLRSPVDSRQAGIETVYQDLALFDNLRPGENFFAGREISGPKWLPRPLQFLSQRKMDAQTRALLDRLGANMPRLDVSVAMMSGGQRQAIAVARAAMFAQKVVILDEPTAALGQRESVEVLRLIARLREQGNAIILITHNMEHVVSLADRAMVLRLGRKVGEIIPTAQNRQEIVSMIIGA